MKQLELVVITALAVITFYEMYYFLVNKKVIYTKKKIKSAKVKSIVFALMVSSLLIIFMHIMISGTNSFDLQMFARAVSFYGINHLISWLLIYYSEKGIIKY